MSRSLITAHCSQKDSPTLRKINCYLITAGSQSHNAASVKGVITLVRYLRCD